MGRSRDPVAGGDIRVAYWRSGDEDEPGADPALLHFASGVVAFILWNNGLRWWPTSRVYLFNNLIPLSTMVSAAMFINEPISPTFWLAMFCIIGGVLLGQTNWQKLFSRWLPCE